MDNEQPTSEQPTKAPKLNAPVAIVIAGVIIAGAILLSNGFEIKRKGGSAEIKQGVSAEEQAPSPSGPSPSQKITLRPVTTDDHIRGSLSAAIKIVEYSDLECPFCKRIHPSLQQVMDEYGKDGKVAWVYRHFPLDALHSKARKEAEATECAAELGGNDAFWLYLDRLFEITPSNNGLDLGQLPDIAEYVGLDRAKFNTCLDSGKYASHIEDDLRDAQQAGGRGTPYSVLIAPDGSTIPISGAQPFSSFQAAIEQALKTQ